MPAEVHDGYDRLGMVYEARGDTKQAADYYRKVIDFVRAHPVILAAISAGRHFYGVVGRSRWVNTNQHRAP